MNYLVAIGILMAGTLARSWAAAGPPDWNLIQWQACYEAPLEGRAETAPGTMPNIVRLEAAHGGGNRILWRMTFSGDFTSSGRILILYLDSDADETTGRTGYPVQGTDRMLTLVDGLPGEQVFNDAGAGRSLKAWIDGSTVVFQDDLACLAARTAASGEPFVYRCRARVLYHKAQPSQEAVQTPWVTIGIAVDPAKKRPMEDASCEGSMIRDLAAYRDGKNLNIRFTTAEPVLARLSGPGSVVQKWGHGLVRNHGWAIGGVPKAGPYECEIALTNDLGQEFERRKLNIETPPERAPRQEKSGRVELSLNVDKARLFAQIKTLKDIRWPVSGGVPFAEGVLRLTERVRLVDSAGKERPVQVETLCTWPDGSVKWLLVEFAADLPRDVLEKFVLEYGPRVTRSRVLPTAWQRPNPASLWTESLDWSEGSDARPKLDSPFRAEKEGPVHCVYTAGGRYVSGAKVSPFGFFLRVHFYPGLPYVRIDHSLRVEDGSPMSLLKSLRLRFAGPNSVNWEPSEKAEIQKQTTIDEAESGTGDNIQKSRTMLPGAAEFCGQGGFAAVCVARFAENYPKALIREADRFAVDLFPKLAPDQYSERPEPRERLYYWFENGFYKLRRGLQKTHTTLYARSQNRTPLGGEMSYWLNNPPVVSASPGYVCSTGAAGPLEPALQTVPGMFDATIKACLQTLERRRAELKEYGFMNFGDWYGERGVNWGNLEYDLPHGLYVQWLRTGDHRYIRRAIEAASHLADIDLVHNDSAAANVGKMWAHSVGHTGGYYKSGEINAEPAFIDGFWDTGHTWCEGLLDIYCATGEKRFLDAGLLVADQLATYATANFRMQTERNGGWPLAALTSAYRYTRDPYYLNAARIVFEEASRRQDKERGGWFARIGECKHDPPHYGGKSFMAGILCTGLVRLHEVLPEDTPEAREFKEKVAKSLIHGCDWMLNEAWQEEVNGFIYAQCPDFYGYACRAAASLCCEPLAYASRISGDPKYLNIAKRALPSSFEPPAWANGKSVGMKLWNTPRFLAEMAQQ